MYRSNGTAYARTGRREELARFRKTATKEGKRCVRSCTSKGLVSKNRTSVLKSKGATGLIQTEAVLAFTQARAPMAAPAAVIVLLRRPPIRLEVGR